MKTVEVTKEVRKLIDAYSIDGESVDKTIVRLISETEAPRKIDRTKTNIYLSEDTFKDIMGRKSYNTESHSDTILNLLKQVQQK